MRKKILSFTAFGFFFFASGAFAVSFFSDVPSDHWASDAIRRVSYSGFMVGDDDSDNFRPDDFVSRAELAVVTDRLNTWTRDYVREQNNDQIEKALVHFERVLNSNEVLLEEKTNSDWTTFNSEILSLSMQLPPYLSGCEESETILDGTEPITDEYVPKGRLLKITCGDFSITAMSPDFTTYEYYYGASKEHPEPYEMLKSCLNFGGPCEGYKLKNLEEEFYVVVYEGDTSGNYYLGTYLPIEDHSHYKTIRIGMITHNDTAVDIPQGLNNVVERNLSEDDLDRVKDFEQILFTIQ